MPATREAAVAGTPMAGPPLTRLHTTLVLTLLTVAGAWLRLSHLGTKSLWLDEGATVALAHASWQHFAWVWWHGEANLQTIYFLLMRGWIQLGDSESWLRLPSALFGIATIPLLYVIARKFMPEEPALAAVALLTFSPTHVYYSQEARSYTLAILMVLLSTYFFVRAVEKCQRQDWMLWALVSTLAFYSHDFTALVLVAQAGSLAFKRGPKRARPMLMWGSIIFLLALPGLTYVFRASPENLHFIWMPRPSFREFWHLAGFFGGYGVKLAVAGILWGAAILTIWRRRHLSDDSDVLWLGALILLWALLPPLILAAISLLQPMFLQRYVVFSLPAALLLGALGMNALNKWKIGLLLVVLLCGMSIPAIVRGYHKPREDWRAASAVVLSKAGSGDAVVFFPFYTRIMLDYYRDRYAGAAPALDVYAPAYYAGGKDVRTLLKALNNNPHEFRRVWTFVDGRGMNDDSVATQEKLQSIYGDPTAYKFSDVTVLEYGR